MNMHAVMVDIHLHTAATEQHYLWPVRGDHQPSAGSPCQPYLLFE